MNRDEYLAENDDFTNYLRGLLNGAPFAHQWHSARNGALWMCDSLLNARQQYRFSINRHFQDRGFHGDSLAANNALLEALSSDLRKAVRLGHEDQAVAISHDIQIWGGTNRGDHNARAITAYHLQPKGFIGYMRLCQEAFCNDALALDVFEGQPYELRSNAGFTKIYALAFDNFIIYDARVAAALGMLVVRHLNSCDQRNVPESLQFCRMSQPNWPREHPLRRNPSVDPYCFPVERNGMPQVHISSNVRANWILTNALEGTNFERTIRNDGGDPLRALEAALFMIGYDLAGNVPYP